MDQMYANTETCLIWLGLADQATEPVIQNLITISDEFYDQLSEATEDFSKQLPFPKYLREPSKVLLNDCTVRDIASFFERPWFSRVWVQQEAILSPVATGRCGGFELLWSDVVRAWTWLQHQLHYFEYELNFNLVQVEPCNIWTDCCT